MKRSLARVWFTAFSPLACWGRRTWPCPPRSRRSARNRQMASGATSAATLGSTRYSPLNQVTPANFETLKEAWRFSPLDVVGPMTARATPSYVGGKLLSVAGPRRHVVSIDPTSGKLLWNFVEPRDLPIEVLDARRLRQGRRVSRNQRPRRRVHLHAGLLPVRARRGNRQAARELGTAGRTPLVSANRCRGSRRGSDSRLGAVDQA